MNKNNLSKNLYELRKKHGLSQEEFAERLCVSRQAISKWERAEAYPDTENLIIISNMFNVSIDELIHGDLSANEVPEDVQNEEDEKNESNRKVFVDLSPSGIQINAKDNEDDVKVNLSIPGIHIKVNDANEHLFDDEDDDDDDDDYNEYPKGKLAPLYALPYPVLVTAAFLLLGFLVDGWGWAWTLFITVPVYYSLLNVIRKRKLAALAYPVLVTFAYCLIGMLTGAWHPWWLLFLTIPIYYPMAKAIDNAIHKK